jgi:small subunit ribosomal protein S17
MDKTVVVRIDRHKRHRLYGKTMSVTRRYKAHDENNECGLGDIVKIAETRPLSREKRWRVVEIVAKGDVAEVAPREIGAHIIEDTLAAAKVEGAARAAAAAAVAPKAAPVADVAPAAEEVAAAPEEAAPAPEEAAAAPEESAEAADTAPDPEVGS